MSFVADASVTLSWILPDERAASDQTLLTRTINQAIVVPAHWSSEVANGLLMAERRKRLMPADSARAIGWLSGLEIVIDEGELQVFAAAIPLARAHQLSVYDALYLELAARKGLELATFDKTLIIAANAVGVKTLP